MKQAKKQQDMSNIDNSWLKLPRSFINWQWYEDTNMVQLYLNLLLNANLLDTQKNGILIKRGENLTTLRQMEEETGLSIRSIRTCLSKLAKTHEIKFKKVKNLRIVILVDFNKYQPIGIDESNPNWIKLYRSIRDWNCYKSPKMLHLLVHFMLKGEPVTQPDGILLWQLITSYRMLNRETGLPIRSIRTCLSKLQKTGEIAVSFLPTHQISIITLCNYDSYSTDFNPIDTELTLCRHKNSLIEKGVTKSLPTHPKAPVTSCGNGTYSSVEEYNRHDGDTVVTPIFEEKPTQDRHKDGTEVSLQIEYKKERIKESSSPSSSACAHEGFFVEVSDVNVGEKENEQKKVVKESYYGLMKDDLLWLQAIAKKFGFTSPSQVVGKLEEFQLDLVCRGRAEHNSLQDCMEHFNDWLEINIGKNKNANRPASSDGERWKGEKFVPKSSEGGIYEGCC